MIVVRILVERLFALLFSLVGTAGVFQGLAVLVAVLAAFALPGRAEGPPWLTQALVQTGVLSAIFLAAGIILSGLRARAPKVSWRAIDPSLPREWIWPALVPTVALPLLAFSLSKPLVPLWHDMLALFDRLGFSDLRHAGNWLLLPILAVLFVPLLETVSALFLTVVPPLLLVLLVTRSPLFRLNGQRLVVAQAALVAASLVASVLFGRFADLAIPPIAKEGGTEAALVVAVLSRGRDVLRGTAMAHALLVGVSAVCLLLLLRVRPDPSEAVLSSSHDGSALLGDSPGRDAR